MAVHSNIVAHQNSTEYSSSCVQCSSTPPACTCRSSEFCVLIDQSCTACSTYQCLSSPTPSSNSGGVSAGAVAGAVVASVVFLILVVGAFWFYRRRLRQRRDAAAAKDAKPDAPARAEDVLNRPDPNEKQPAPEAEPSTVRIYSGASGGIINLDPESHPGSISHSHSRRESTQSNPFGDDHSIQTTSTGTQSNVIPIALVSPSSFSQETSAVPTQAVFEPATSMGPNRPARSPDLNLGLEQRSVSRDVLPGKSTDEQSQRSGLSGYNNRASYLSTGSFASDLLNEAPVIVTPTRGIVKQQVVGLVKAEVIRTSPGSPSKPGDNLRPPSGSTRPPVRSPLAASSFGPSDVVHEVAEDEHESPMRSNPFGDEHSPYDGEMSQRSPAPSATTFGSPEPSPGQYSQSVPAQYYGDGASQATGSSAGRPLSTYTQAASIVGSVIGADIGSATRVHLGLDQIRANNPGEGMPHTASSCILNSPRSPYRMTSAKLITTPPSGGRALEQQQQRALQEIDQMQNSRMSLSSVVSSSSTRADSILESFPFVPPSPISNRPIRTPPRSPLAKQSFANANGGNAVPPVPIREVPARESMREAPVSPLPPPPRPLNRQALGMSVASQSSTASNGLGSFPFQIDSGTTDNATSESPPSSFLGRQRASLDTLALTSDLSSYPLKFERNAPPPPPPR